MNTWNVTPDLLNDLLLTSGVSEIPGHWKVRKLEDLLARERGISVGVMYPGKHTSNGVPLLKVGDFSNSILNPNPEFRISHDKNHEYRRTMLEGDELLLTLVGDLGQCAVVPPYMAGWNAARAIAVIRLENPEDAAYVRLCLLSPPLQHLMRAWANTTVQPTLNLKEIRQLPILWPPQNERRRIAEILGRLDGKIEVHRRINRTLEAMAQALYKHWFVDFGPFQDGEFVESELGPIPAGWHATTVGDVTEIVNGATPRTTVDEYWNGDICWATPTDMTSLSSPVISDTERKITQAGLENCSATLLPVGSVLVTSRATLGVVAINHVPMATNQGFKSIVAGPDVANHFMLLYVKNNLDEIENRANGSTFLEINTRNFKALPIIVPSKPVMQGFEQLAKPKFDQIYINEQENHKLAAIRDYLLPKLLSGEVPVSAAES